MTFKIPLPILSEKEYAKVFTDLDFWTRHVLAILNNACLLTSVYHEPKIVTPNPGTFPVFIVDGKYVVKLYGPYYNGESTFLTEQFLFSLFNKNQLKFTPSLISSGSLAEIYSCPSTPTLWRWPFVVLSVMPGCSLKSSRLSYTPSQEEKLVQQLAPMVNALHSVKIPRIRDIPESLRPTFFKVFIRELYDPALERNNKRKTLPKHLLDQLPSYLPSFEDFMKFFDSDSLKLIHADLHLEHVFTTKMNDSINVSGLIDMGDCRLAPISYEWVSLHMITFLCKKNLLAQFFRAYGFSVDDIKLWSYKMMCITLIYEFDAMNTASSGFQIDLSKVKTLEELAEMLWNYKDLDKVAPMRSFVKPIPTTAPISIPKPSTSLEYKPRLSESYEFKVHNGPTLRSNSFSASSPVHIRRN
jgi:Ser/Thr protein kinase RdoA (MazF antagonist)